MVVAGVRVGRFFAMGVIVTMPVAHMIAVVMVMVMVMPRRAGRDGRGLGRAGAAATAATVDIGFFVAWVVLAHAMIGNLKPTSRSSMSQYRIGETARQSGVTAANIRYYEHEGLVRPSGRAENDYRFFTDADLHRLRFIRMCRAMDMSLDEVRTLLALDLNSKVDCAAANQAVTGHLQHVRERLHELQILEQELLALQSRCDGSDTRCHIIEALHAQADAPLEEARAPAVGAAKRHV